MGRMPRVSDLIERATLKNLKQNDHCKACELGQVQFKLWVLGIFSGAWHSPQADAWDPGRGCRHGASQEACGGRSGRRQRSRRSLCCWRARQIRCLGALLVS